MILLIGIPSEPPLAMVADALRRLRLPFEIVNQRETARHAIELEIGPDGVDGTLVLGDREIALAEVTGAYDRATDPGVVPEMQGLDDDAPDALRALRLQSLLSAWLQIGPATVVNRLRPMGTNASKPAQAQVIRDHFHVPDLLVTDDPEAARRFVEVDCADTGAIYKSVSGERSIVMAVEADDIERLDALGPCPVQFQRRIAGTDCRVHVVGDTVHACRIETDALDYRYARMKGAGDPKLTPVTLPPDWAEACRRLTRALGLEFSGIDLMVDDDGTPWCLEVNTCPAFSYFDVGRGQPIATAVARHLAGIGTG
ncbi:MAG: hypothetical protein RLO51_01465 [Thalassobaculum sp.]|uniref:ATP-grasp domain-containing protein n=1 Tax=Thalassobaculum sp. TaxID=2022740 RepID=UPI0032ED03E7